MVAARRRKGKSRSASSQPQNIPDRTLGPYTFRENTLTESMGQSATDAPIPGRPDSGEPLASGSAALIDKFLQNRLRPEPRSLTLLLVLGWFLFISWLFVQDNKAGQLDDFAGIKWFGAKAGLYTILAILSAALIALVARFWKQRD